MTHGSPAGYKRHQRSGETPCDECREAYNAAQRTHGHPWAVRRHMLDGSPVCDMCLYFVCYVEHLSAQRYLTKYRPEVAA